MVTEAAGFALLAESTSDASRTQMFGFNFFGSGLSYFIANVVGGWLATPFSVGLGLPEHDPTVLRGLLLLSAAIGATSALPILRLASGERPAHVDAPRSWSVLTRFALVNLCFGLGAGSFLPFLNLFFSQRFDLDFAAVGVAIGLINVTGGVGGLLHTRVAPRLGAVRSLAAFWIASLPFALVGAFASSVFAALPALFVRGVLMTAATPTLEAYTISAFHAAERSGAQAIVSTMWALGAGMGALASGAVRAWLGPSGFTVNLLTLVCCYILATAIFAASFGRRR